MRSPGAGPAHNGMLALPTFIPARTTTFIPQTVKRCEVPGLLIGVLDLLRVLNEHSTQLHVDQPLQQRIGAVRVHVVKGFVNRRPRTHLLCL